MSAIGEVKNTNEFEWKIPHFSLLSNKNTICHFSPTFSFCNESWCLRLYPNGHNKMSIGYISLYLRRKSSGPPIRVKYSVGLKTLSGQKDSERQGEHIFKEAEEGTGFKKLLLKSQLFEKQADLLPADVITLFCSVKSASLVTPVEKVSTGICSLCEKTVDADNLSVRQKKDKEIICAESSAALTLQNWCDHQCQEEETNRQFTTPLIEKPKMILKYKALLDYKELFLKKEDCDVIIKVKEQEFHVHKSILQARLPTFSSAMKYETKEKVTGIIEIEDFDPCHFSDFLYFLYCGEIENLTVENVFSLFTLADKYIILDLKSMCMDFIKQNISINTFCNTIALALLHSEAELVKLCMDFFAKNMKEIMATVEWQSYILKNPLQCNEIMLKALEYDNQK